MERHPRVRCQVLGCRAWAKRGSHYCVAHEAMSQRQAARGEPNTPEMAREAPRPQCRVAGCRSLAASGSDLCAVHRDQDVSPDHPAAVALYDLMARLNLHVDLGPSAVRLEMDMLQTVRRLFVAGMQDLGAGGHDVDRLLDTVYARLETEEPAASPRLGAQLALPLPADADDGPLNAAASATASAARRWAAWSADLVGAVDAFCAQRDAPPAARAALHALLPAPAAAGAAPPAAHTPDILAGVIDVLDESLGRRAPDPALIALLRHA